MPKFEVTSPDGTKYEVDAPEGATQAQIIDYVAKQHKPEPVADKSYLERVGDNLKFGASAAARGVASLPALGMDALNWVKSGYGVLDPENGGEVSFRAPKMQASQAVQNFGVQPQGSTEKYVAAGIEGLTGGALGPGGLAAPGRMALTGGMAGLGSHAGGELTGDKWYGKLLGGLAGGVTGATIGGQLAGVRPQSAAVAKEAIEGVSPQQMKAAQELMERSAAAMPPVKMDLAQALEGVGVPASNMTTLRNELASKMQGKGVRQTLNNQPQQYQMLADDRVNSLPGANWTQDQAANNVSKAATDTINAAKGERSAAVKGSYEAAGPVSETARAGLLAEIDDLLKQPGMTDQVKAAALDLKQKFSPKLDPKSQMPDSVPLHALDVDTAIGSAVGPFKGTPLSPPDPKSLGQMKYLAGRLNEVLKGASPEVKQAEQTFSQISRDVIEPMKQGQIGKMATPRGYKPDIQASATKLESLFNKGTDVVAGQQVSPISELANGLKKADPEAFPAAAKAFLRNKLDTAFEATIAGHGTTSGSDADAVFKALFQHRNQMQGMRDMVAGIGNSYGLPKQQVVDMVNGMENLAQITRAIRNRPQSAGGMDAEQLKSMAGSSFLAKMVRATGQPFQKTGAGIENLVMGKTYREFDQLLTTPEGAQALMKLGQTPVMSNKAITILGSFYGINTDADWNK